MQSLNTFDQSDATIRLILTLNEHPEGLPVLLLHKRMMEKWGVGRGATDTARTICEELKLIYSEKEIKGGPRAAKVYYLTKKGHKLANNLIETQRILEDD